MILFYIPLPPRNAGYEIGGVKRKSGGIFVQDKKTILIINQFPAHFQSAQGILRVY